MGLCKLGAATRCKKSSLGACGEAVQVRVCQWNHSSRLNHQDGRAACARRTTFAPHTHATGLALQGG
jgi:hypothetical protein